jgi:hypothetical protein
MRSPLSLTRSSDSVLSDGWPNAIPPLSDHTAAYLAAQMRRADEVAEASRMRRVSEAGIGADPGMLVIEGILRAVWAGLGRRIERLRGTRWDSARTRSGIPLAQGLVRR